MPMACSVVDSLSFSEWSERQNDDEVEKTPRRFRHLWEPDEELDEDYPWDNELLAHYPNIDPVRIQLAYGDRALPKLNRELLSKDFRVRQIACTLLCDFIHDPEQIGKAHTIGVIKTLKSLLSDVDPVVREKTAECMKVISGHCVGIDILLQTDVIPTIARQFGDRYLAVRVNSHHILQKLSAFSRGAEGIVQAKLISILLQKLTEEPTPIKKMILNTLHYCLKVDTEQALQANAMVIFKTLLTHSSSIVRANTARDVLDLSVPLKGKQSACETDIIPTLVHLLSDDNSLVRAKSAGALMMITITTEGKHGAINANAIQPLLFLLIDPQFEVRLNAVKTLTNLAEAPQGRQKLLLYQNKFLLLLKDSNKSVREAAAIALKVIRWKP